MEMEDHNQHNQYSIDLHHFISGRPTPFPSIPQPQPVDLFTSRRNLQPPPPQGHHHHHYDMMMLMPRGGGLHEFHSDSSTSPCVGGAGDNISGSTNIAATPAAAATPATTTTTLSALEADGGCSFGGDGGTGRWPRQETLTLLEIRSRLDSKFKEANQKGPLWDEVSRIMSEEHGYQRSGKKCREKFENLYKYYKKTKEGKAGRQDGKHYRFFRQLEALYGENSNAASIQETQYPAGTSLQFNTNSSAQANQETIHTQKHCDSLSLSNNSSEFDTSSSEGNDISTAMLLENDLSEKRRKRRGGWKAKIKDFIDSQMKKLMERQEAWLEKLTKTLEQKEQERVMREEEWRKQEAERIDKEHKFWAKERAWIEARDTALMKALHKLTGSEVNVNASSSPEELMRGNELHNQSNEENQNDNASETINNRNQKGDSWPESEITRLIQLRNSLESKFQQSGCMEEVLWEEIAVKMACLGYERSALMCKDKWNSISNYLVRKTKEGNKKRKENSRSNSCYFQSSDQSVYNPGSAYCEINEQSSSPANSNAAADNAVNDNCFRFFMSDGGENLWENYGLKLNNGDQNQ